MTDQETPTEWHRFVIEIPEVGEGSERLFDAIGTILTVLRPECDWSFYAAPADETVPPREPPEKLPSAEDVRGILG